MAKGSISRTEHVGMPLWHHLVFAAFTVVTGGLAAPMWFSAAKRYRREHTVTRYA